MKYIFNPSLWNINNIAPSIVNIYLGLRPREYLSIFHVEGLNIYNLYIYIYVIVINRSEVYSEVREPRPEGGSPRVKILLTRLLTEYAVYNYYIARGLFRLMLN